MVGRGEGKRGREEGEGQGREGTALRRDWEGRGGWKMGWKWLVRSGRTRSTPLRHSVRLCYLQRLLTGAVSSPRWGQTVGCGYSVAKRRGLIVEADG